MTNLTSGKETLIALANGEEVEFKCGGMSWLNLDAKQQPEALPFIDDNPQSLNEQYAEIEEVRQEIKVKSDSDSDHAADAMSYGIMGVGAANGGAKMRENNHYFINVSDVDEVDFYEIAKRYNVTDPAIQHILKKCLAIGNRGHKDLETDLKDILKTAKRALQINGFGDNNG